MLPLVHNTLNLIVIFIGTYLLLYYAGLGATVLLLPKRFSKWFLFITPIVGFSLLTALPQALSFLKWPSVKMLWLIIGLCLVINSLAFKQIKKVEIPKTHFKIFAVHFIFLLILSIPLIVKGLQTITVNSDVLVYTTSADYAQEYGLVKQDTDSNTFKTSGYNWFIKNEKRLGLVYFQGFINILFHINSMESYLPLSLITISLSILGGIIFSQYLSLFKQKTTILLMMFLMFFNTLYMSSVFIGFLSMNAVMPVLILTLILGKHFIDHMHQFDLPKTIYLAILTGSILATHPTYLVYILSIVGMYLCIILCLKKKNYCYRQFSLKSILVLLLCFNTIFFKPIYLFIQRMIPTFLPAIGSETNVETAAGIGNIHFFVPLYELLGVVPHSHEDVSLMKWKGYRGLLEILINEPKNVSIVEFGIELIFSLFIIFAIIIIFLYFKRKQNGTLLFSICIFLTIIVSLGIAYIQKYYYGYYKSIHLLSFFFIILFCAAIESALERSCTKTNRLAFSSTKCIHLFIAILVLFNLCSSSVLTKRYIKYMDDFASNHFSELRLLSDSLKPQDKLLLFEDAPSHIRELVVNYYVRSPQLILRTSLDLFKAEASSPDKNKGFYVIFPNEYSSLFQLPNSIFTNKKGKYYSIIQLK